jgi:hypothetical protein
LTFIVVGFKIQSNGSLSKAEIITSIKEEADELSASLKKLGFRVTYNFLPEEDADQVRQLSLLREVEALGEEFFKEIKLETRA